MWFTSILELSWVKDFILSWIQLSIIIITIVVIIIVQLYSQSYSGWRINEQKSLKLCRALEYNLKIIRTKFQGLRWVF